MTPTPTNTAPPATPAAPPRFDLNETLDITRGPVPTRDVAELGAHAVTAVIKIDADRIGFHVEPVPTLPIGLALVAAPDAQHSQHYLTVAPEHVGGAVTLLALLDSATTDRVLDVIATAIGDQLAGDLELECFPTPALNGPRWWVTRVIYTDADGERSAS